jgi:hypothetical protein
MNDSGEIPIFFKLLNIPSGQLETCMVDFLSQLPFNDRVDTCMYDFLSHLPFNARVDTCMVDFLSHLPCKDRESPLRFVQCSPRLEDDSPL